MDPSEFEGTVQRHDSVLSAGVLEKLLVKSDEPKFQNIDLSKEVDNFKVKISTLIAMLFYCCVDW